MKTSPDSSATRQALGRITKQITRRIQEAMSVRAELLAGSLSKTHKICGKPNCKCARGDKHPVYQLSWTENGKRRSAHVKRTEVATVQAAIERYRKLRRCRAEVLKLAAEAASLMDSLVETLRVSAPKKRNDRRQ